MTEVVKESCEHILLTKVEVCLEVLFVSSDFDAMQAVVHHSLPSLEFDPCKCSVSENEGVVAPFLNSDCVLLFGCGILADSKEVVALVLVLFGNVCHCDAEYLPQRGHQVVF